MDSLAAEILYKNIKFEYFILLYLILYILDYISYSIHYRNTDEIP
jgi:hypothetical protein